MGRQNGVRGRCVYLDDVRFEFYWCRFRYRRRINVRYQPDVVMRYRPSRLLRTSMLDICFVLAYQSSLQIQRRVLMGLSRG